MKRCVNREEFLALLRDRFPEIAAQIDEVSAININVFVHGESGTGKELVAKALHFNSAYKAGDFVAINCGAIPEELQENEFFGHEKGAYTSADDSRMGKLEVANEEPAHTHHLLYCVVRLRGLVYGHEGQSG